MWIARPIYELLPYLYMCVGLTLLGVAWLADLGTFAGLLMWLGALSLLAGLVLWLRRRDYRTRQSEYDARSLDD
jgi:hypothetical protein